MMRIKKLLLAGAGVLAASQAFAACTPDLLTSTTTVPLILIHPDGTIMIDADAPVSMDTPVHHTPLPRVVANHKIEYINCEPGVDRYSKRSLLPEAPAGAGKGMYKTLVDGILVKPLWSNGAAGLAPGTFPSNLPVKDGRFVYPPVSWFQLEFYKTRQTLHLQDAMRGDRLLSSGTAVQTEITAGNDSVAQQLNIADLRIISTPVCRLKGEKVVDFATVSLTNLSREVTRPLNFSLTCATDYGSYSVEAALSATDATADKAYIQVTDSSGKKDRLKIRVNDSNGRLLTVDGRTPDIKYNVPGSSPAAFTWTATLLRASANSPPPANGAFSAMAEIVLQLK